MNQNKKNARIAGLWYLLMAVSGPIGLLIVPSKIIVVDNATATTQNIISNELLFRIGIASNLFCQICFIFLVLSLYRLFKGINEKYSKLMVSLVIAAVPIAFVVELTQVAALQLVSGAEYLNAFEPRQLHALVLALLNLHEQGILLAGLFWGLWLFPFGWLAIKSGFIPKIIGILLIVGCFSYVVDSSVALLFPQFRNVLSNVLMLPLAAGEISMVLWLLIKGVKEKEAVSNEII